MGVPRLYRYIADRFPYAIRSVTNRSHRKKIDHLYIDFNGLIHESTNRASYAPFDRPEIDVLNQTFSYLEELIAITEPELVYIAIDGAAPNAKIKQQRQRRIFGAITSDSQREFRKKVSGYGDVFQSQETLSGAEITPGSLFMGRLTSFLVAKITEALEIGEFDCQFEINDSSNPGEGEHKILNRLREFYGDQFKKPFAECTDSGYTIEMAVPKKKWSLKPEAIDLETSANADVIGSVVDDEQYTPPTAVTNGKCLNSTSCATGSDTIRSLDDTDGLKNIPRVGVFGMDGDLILLLLGLNAPEITILKRHPGLFVTEIESVENSKSDPWDNGIVAMDIDVIREGLLYEMLGKYFENNSELRRLALHCSSEPFLKEFIVELPGEDYPRMPHQYIQLVRERILHSETADRVIHDFIALALFVGNDFLPEVPGQSIKNGALEELIRLYKLENVMEIPFKFLLDENCQIDLAEIEQMFEAIGENVEYTEVLRDMQQFTELAQHLKKLSDDFKSDISAEHDEMKEELGQGIVELITKAPLKELIKANTVRPRIMEYYRMKYYKKFAELELKDAIECPVNLNKTELSHLALLDHYQNQIEEGLPVDVEIENQVNGSPVCLAYKGLHHLVRTYLKTMQWVLNYYFGKHDKFEWSWSFDYPFTPLCSDMAVYCKLFLHNTTVWNNLVEKRSMLLKPEPISSEAERKQDETDEKTPRDGEKDVMELLKNYRGPEFIFEKDSPRDALEQLVFTVPQESIKLIPEHIREQLDPSFFKKEPRHNDVLVAHYESAFNSLNQKMDLSRPNLEFMNKQPHYEFGFGWNPNFTCFYKHYPIGITDGVDFEHISAMLTGVDRDGDYYEAFYSPIGPIIIGTTIRETTLQHKNLDLFVPMCSPGSQVTENLYKRSNDPSYGIFDQFMGTTVEKTYVLAERSRVDAFHRISYLEYSQGEAIGPPIKREMPLSRVCNIHLLSDTGFTLALESMKMNIVAEGVRGNVELSYPVQQCDFYGGNNCELKKYSNPKYLTMEMDLFMTSCRPFVCQEIRSSPIPCELLKLYEDRVQCSILHNGLISYDSMYLGVPIGISYAGSFYLRSVTGGILGQYSDETKHVEEIAEKCKLESIDAELRSIIDAYYTNNKGRFIRESEPIVYVLQSGARIPPSHDEWITEMLTIRSNLPTNSFMYLAFLDELSVMPVPLDLLHRKFERTAVLRSATSEFAFVCSEVGQLEDEISRCERFEHIGGTYIRRLQYSAEQAKQMAHQLIGRFGNVIPRKMIQNALYNTPAELVDEFEVDIPENIEITEREISGLKYSMMMPKLEKLGINLPNEVLQRLLGQLRIECADLATRDVGLTVLTSSKYDPNYIREGEPTLRCALALSMAQRAFPDLFAEIAALCQGKAKDELTADKLSFGNMKESFMLGRSEIRAPIFDFSHVPVYSGKPVSNMQLASVISAASLFIHRFLVPVNRQMLIPRCFSEAYGRDVIDYLSSVLRSVKMRPSRHEKLELEFSMPLMHAELGDFIFSPRHGILVVVAVSASSFRAISHRHLFSLNNTLPWNAIEGNFGEEYFLLRRGAISIQEDFSYDFQAGRSTEFAVDLDKEIDQWFKEAYYANEIDFD